MKNVIKYGSKRIEYPQIGYSIMVPLHMPEGELRELFPVIPVFNDLKIAGMYIRELVGTGEVSEYFQGTLVAARLTLEREWPLKKEYWKNPELSYDPKQRKELMIKLFATPSFFRLLVTPSTGTDDWGGLAAAMPFSVGRDEDIEIFMQTSDWPVDPEAQSAALYRIEKVFGYDLETGEMTENQVIERRVVN